MKISLAVIERFGADTTEIAAILGGLSITVGLALQGSLGNFAGVILILILKLFRNGYVISANEETGEVRFISIFTKTLNT